MATNPQEVAYETEFNPEDFEVAKQVSLDFLVIDPSINYFVRFDTAFEPDKTSFSERMRAQNKNTDPDKKDKPIDIALVRQYVKGNREGVKYKLMSQGTLQSQLEETYPETEKGRGDWGFVGKLFQLSKSAEKQGKGARKYWNFKIQEMRPIVKATAPESKPGTPTQQISHKKSA